MIGTFTAVAFIFKFKKKPINQLGSRLWGIEVESREACKQTGEGGNWQIDPIHDFNFYCGGFYVKLEIKLLGLGLE